MAFVSFGEVKPLQGVMLRLAGYGPVEVDAGRDLVLAQDDGDYATNVATGAAQLRKLTRLDHGVSLADWHAALLTTPEFAWGYRSRPGWKAVEAAVVAQIERADRARLEGLAAAQG
ncbi:hypothetical protein [Rhodalgimonas zhirmunskyi]|uniref:Uncharacterized protein n=1 Tax=Rhodalgimonas zhirmunskyi TaxID=2964767 RepID=A0AAJ1UEH5_9RHOB|nr:hypothetical protein [Rhodoalgimonas zhirmunskyi]MDQ2094826.1 hypothetical protein [Rhodoalgimonas zhirmunskyi]